MQFDYREFHIVVSPLDEGGRYYARARIYRRASAGVDAVEVMYSGDLVLRTPASGQRRTKTGRQCDYA
jgi:hypothetical protein